ncbi:phenylalanine--tRNA ligase subunit beta [Candidatus Gracilibacteria bacterium]|nr:phenylalanine--tRNA ligase subunit beta [Candidatus Gracilibacteria bacterium]
MKYSYNTLKQILPFLTSEKQVADDIIMHIAEVEGIHSRKKDFENIVYGKIKKIDSHPDANNLKVCMVDVGEEDDLQIVCGGSNLKTEQAVAVAKIGASVVWHGQGDPVVMKKTAIRGVDSYGMICASDEIGLKNRFVAKDEKEILDLSDIDAKVGTNLAEVLGEDDAIIEIDNKGINHRPDMFSHIGLARELCAINSKVIDLHYEKNDFSKEKDIGIKNEIPEIVKRYIGLSISGVGNIEPKEEIKQVVTASGNNSKGLLVDITNYSLYLYGQPTHCFDADKITGNIIIRYAKQDEEFTALDNKTYKLTTEDIVIADKEKVLALGGVIGGASSAVSNTTKNIIVEGAWFNPKTVRKTGRRHGIRTDSLNVFEKDIPLEFPIYGVSLIYRKLKEYFPASKIEGCSDVYPVKQEIKKVRFDLNFVNNLIGANYSEKESLEILENLGIKKDGDKLIVPFWRKDLNYKADIAEEIARIHGFDKITTTIPRINLGAIIQDNIYKLKNDVRDFFVDRGFYDLYNYSFVNEALMKKVLGDTAELIPLKNSLSEDMTHMKGSLIPNLILSIEKNIKQVRDLSLFEFEKVFAYKSAKVIENYSFAGVVTSDKEVVYYDLQKTISDLFKKLAIDNFMFTTPKTYPSFAHKGRTASIIVRGQEVGFVGEINPAVVNNFSIDTRIGFFEIDADKLKTLVYSKIKTKEVSAFQENNFDLSFVVPKEKAGKDIQISIAKTDPKIIQKVELFDVYENEEKLPGKRSLSFKIYIQSLEGTLSDEVKNNLIKSIIERVEKIGGVLR